MKHIVLTLILALATLGTTAKPTAATILNNTRARIQSAGDIQGDFTITTFQGTTPTGVTSGTMSMRGQKYTLSTSDMTTWYDGHTQWTYIKGTDEVNVTTPTQAELQTSSPTAFLSIYDKGYKATLTQSTLRQKRVWQVTLRATRRQQPQTIVIDIDQSDYTPMCIRVLNDGNWTRIAIHSFKTGQHLSDTHFQFSSSDHPGVEVIDMR